MACSYPRGQDRPGDNRPVLARYQRRAQIVADNVAGVLIPWMMAQSFI